MRIVAVYFSNTTMTVMLNTGTVAKTGAKLRA